jgi:DNA adenine methylase
VIKRPILRYHGGKWKLAPWIISHFPKHRVYVEPFGGGASVLLRKDRSYAEVYNDKWDTVVNVFAVMRDPKKAARLKKAIELTPFSRTEFMNASLNHCRGDVEAARRTILRSFAGFGSASTNGEFTTGFRANSNRSGTTPAHDWVNYPLHVAAYIERLKGVIIENKTAEEVMKQHDGFQTLFYVDPPYPAVTRNMDRGNAAYAHDMSDDNHRQLANTLHSLKGMVVLSGYPCDLYDKELYPTWKRIEREHLADGARKRTEVIWLNDACVAGLTQQRLFG